MDFFSSDKDSTSIVGTEWVFMQTQCWILLTVWTDKESRQHCPFIMCFIHTWLYSAVCMKLLLAIIHQACYELMAKAFTVSCSSCPPVRHQDRNTVPRSQTWGNVYFIWQVSVECLRKMIFSVILFTPHLDVAPEGFRECPPWGIMRAKRRKVNSTPLGTALKADSILSFVTPFSLEDCKATFLADKHF